jgi:hypothetical protein
MALAGDERADPKRRALFFAVTLDGSNTPLADG